MKKIMCIFLGFALIMMCNAINATAYSIPKKEEIILMESEDARSCKDFQSFKDYMKKNYDIEVESIMSAYNLNSVKAAAAGIEYVINEYPALKGKIKKFKMGYSCNHAMGTVYSGTIYFYSSMFHKSDKEIEDWLSAVEKGGISNHSKNNENLFSYGVHEASHMLTTLILEENGEIFNTYKMNHNQSKAIISEIIGHQKEQMREISTYAATNEMECIAEAMCDYLINEDNSADLSKKIAEKFDKYRI